MLPFGGLFFFLLSLFYGILILSLPFIIHRIFTRLRERDEEIRLESKLLENQDKVITDIQERLDRIEKVIQGETIQPESEVEVTEEPQKTTTIPLQPREPEKQEEPEPLLPAVIEPESEPLTEAEPTAKPGEQPLHEVTEKISPLPVAPQTTEQPALSREQLKSIREPAVEKMSEEEWEALVGGNWLNKLGVVILVIGLALFLGYSLKYFGPAGRIAIGLVISFAMLFGGIWLEQKDVYKNYGRGLIGGGWAGIYFTTYAMYGLEAARIIDDPMLAMSLLGLVAAGMIIHSLRYQSEVVTGLAFFVGFLTLIISPVTAFSVGASLPLAAALVIITYRFSWSSMMIFGMIFTYGTFVFRFGGELIDAGIASLEFAVSQGILLTYWLLFESFDLIDLRRRSLKLGLQQTLLPLNACGFIGVSLLFWPRFENLYLLFSFVSLAYMISSLLRFMIRSSSVASDESDVVTGSGYKVAVTLASLSAIVAIFLRFNGNQVTVALLLEAELIFLSGLVLRQSFLCSLARAIFLLPVLKFMLVDMNEPGQVTLAGLQLQAGSPVGALIAVTLFFNRMLLARIKEDKPVITDRAIYSSAGAAILLLLPVIEVPVEYIGISWLVLALPLRETGMLKECSDLRYISYVIALLAFIALVGNILAGIGDASAWIVFGLGSLLSYAAGVRLHFYLSRQSDKQFLEREICYAAGTVLFATLLWHILPTALVAIGWGVLAIVLIEFASYKPLSVLRFHGHLLLGATFIRLFMANFILTGDTAGISHRLLTVTPFVLLYYQLSSRLKHGVIKATQLRWEAMLSKLYFYAPVILVTVLLRFELGRSLAVVGWSVLFVIVYYLGLRNNNRDLRIQAYVLSMITFVRCWATNFELTDTYLGLQGSVLTGAIVVVAFFMAYFLSPRQVNEEGAVTRLLHKFDLHTRSYFAGMGSLLLAVLLYHVVVSHLLTVAWALEGITLLVVGFFISERVLRLSGLFLLIICIFKVFLYDFRELDPVFRIISFIVLGLLLLGASMIYTRYREQLKRYF